MLAVGSAKQGEWAGAPMPLSDLELVIEPTYPHAKMFEDLSGKEIRERQRAILDEPDDRDAELVYPRGSFWSTRHGCEVLIVEHQGKRKPVLLKSNDIPRRLRHDLNTIGASYAWGIEQEAAAVQLLGTLVRHHTFKQYLLTGMFFETSKRSGVTYLFRKLKPTVALKAKPDGYMKVLCSLCLHPIAYYSDSWAGAMVPTDDVVAHLMLMRGDEVMFWRRANQHPPSSPGAAL